MVCSSVVGSLVVDTAVARDLAVHRRVAELGLSVAATLCFRLISLKYGL